MRKVSIQVKGASVIVVGKILTWVVCYKTVRWVYAWGLSCFDGRIVSPSRRMKFPWDRSHLLGAWCVLKETWYKVEVPKFIWTTVLFSEKKLLWPLGNLTFLSKPTKSTFYPQLHPRLIHVLLTLGDFRLKGRDGTAHKGPRTKLSFLVAEGISLNMWICLLCFLFDSRGQNNYLVRNELRNVASSKYFLTELSNS